MADIFIDPGFSELRIGDYFRPEWSENIYQKLSDDNENNAINTRNGKKGTCRKHERVARIKISGVCNIEKLQNYWYERNETFELVLMVRCGLCNTPITYKDAMIANELYPEIVKPDTFYCRECADYLCDVKE